MDGGKTEDYWVEEFTEQQPAPSKAKRRNKPKKLEFDGWASKPLIEFLKAIGKDSGNQLSQKQVTDIVEEYVKLNNLVDPSKKKKVVCDDWLRYLFGRKLVNRLKLSVFLERHLAENHDDSDDEDLSCSGEDEKEEEKGRESRKRKASSLGKKVAPPTKKVPEVPKSCFASIVRENMKLVYLRRSLMKELLKDPDSFEHKVVGSYVRVRSDPNDFSQRNSHQLLQVTGVRKCGDADGEIFLQVPILKKEVSISALSEENFTEEDLEDLLRRINAGSAKRPTVVELQEKVQTLHQDITKQWIARELTLLKNLIDISNDKGRRRELTLFEYLERRKKLEQPSEQSRLLLEVPNVIAEELEPEATQVDPQESVQQEETSCAPEGREIETETTPQDPVVRLKDLVSPSSIIRGSSANMPFGDKQDQCLSNHHLPSADNAGSGDAAIPSQVTLARPYVCREGNGAYINGTTSVKEAEGRAAVAETPLLDVKMDEEPETSAQQQKQALEAMNSFNRTMSVKEADGGVSVSEACLLDKKLDDTLIEAQTIDLSDEDAKDDQPMKNGSVPQVIELSDDDNEDDHPPARAPEVDHPYNPIWYYTDPQGHTQGPFAMATIKRWRDLDYFEQDFRVWREGHSPVLLEDVIRRIFPN